jgi:long-chain acyl-CoA synthetase
LLRLRFDVETTLRDIEQKRATAFPGVPTMWIALAHHPGIETRDLSSLRYCGSGGAPLPIEVAQRFERLTGHRLGGGWGMTETSPAGTSLPVDGPAKPGSIGLPLPGIEMDIVSLDDPRRRLPAGEVGEIRVKGPNVTRGYWNRPEETAAAFVDGYLLTGDVGSMDEEGYFTIVDRKKDMIISGGFNVYPQMIEQAIYEHPQVEEVAVIGIPDDYRGEAAKAFVKLRPGAPGFTLDELRGFLADKLGRHEMPAALEIRDSLPRTAVGKLSKVDLRQEEGRKYRARAGHSA